jgi:hypothetical protein
MADTEDTQGAGMPGLIEPDSTKPLDQDGHNVIRPDQLGDKAPGPPVETDTVPLDQAHGQNDYAQMADAADVLAKLSWNDLQREAVKHGINIKGQKRDDLTQALLMSDGLKPKPDDEAEDDHGKEQGGAQFESPNIPVDAEDIEVATEEIKLKRRENPETPEETLAKFATSRLEKANSMGAHGHVLAQSSALPQYKLSIAAVKLVCIAVESPNGKAETFAMTAEKLSANSARISIPDGHGGHRRLIVTLPDSIMVEAQQVE